MEMAFVDERMVQDCAEQMMCQVFRATLGVDLPQPFPRLSWREAMDRFGSDKPDLRIAGELVTVDEYVRHIEFKVFAAPEEPLSLRRQPRAFILKFVSTEPYYR